MPGDEGAMAAAIAQAEFERYGAVAGGHRGDDRMQASTLATGQGGNEAGQARVMQCGGMKATFGDPGLLVANDPIEQFIKSCSTGKLAELDGSEAFEGSADLLAAAALNLGVAGEIRSIAGEGGQVHARCRLAIAGRAQDSGGEPVCEAAVAHVAQVDQVDTGKRCDGGEQCFNCMAGIKRRVAEHAGVLCVRFTQRAKDARAAFAADHAGKQAYQFAVVAQRENRQFNTGRTVEECVGPGLAPVVGLEHGGAVIAGVFECLPVFAQGLQAFECSDAICVQQRLCGQTP